MSLCLLILLPANDAARTYCNQIESSSLCQIQINSNNVQKGLIYKCMKKTSTQMKINQNSNSSSLTTKKKSQCLLSSLQNLTINQRRRVKVNKNFRSPSSILSRITNSNIPQTFNLWYNQKKELK